MQLPADEYLPTEHGGGDRPLRIVLAVKGLVYVRLLDSVIRGLLERGHRVHLVFESRKATAREDAWRAALDRHPRFTSSRSEALREDPWGLLAIPVRQIADYLYYLGPDFRHIPSIVAKPARHVDSRYRSAVRRVGLASELGRRVILWALRVLERAIPPSVPLVAELTSLEPDVLVLVPHLMPGARHSEYVRAARVLGIPTCVCVASWDNLTTKQRLGVIPERVVVWNEVQKSEAVSLHHVPPERVVVTGAQSFDQWFERQPRPRNAFCGIVGLDPAVPYVLYLGSALFPAAVTEAEFVRTQWIPALREDERLRGVSILVRPHPQRLPEWDAVDLEGFPNVAVWPATGVAMPVDEESRADFFDSLYHGAAVVGLSTTAMIEAAVVGRPVHTILRPEFAESQATVHFNYLLKLGGGLLEVATTWEEHRDLLVRSIAGEDGSSDRARHFLEEFVRPQGIAEPSLPRVLDAIETTVGRPVPRVDRGPRWLELALRASLAIAKSFVRLRRRCQPSVQPGTS